MNRRTQSLKEHSLPMQKCHVMMQDKTNKPWVNSQNNRNNELHTQTISLNSENVKSSQLKIPYETLKPIL